MVRTVLRNKSEDGEDLVQLLDRTGILAASVPRQRQPESIVDKSTEQFESVVPRQGFSRSSVLGWVMGALMLVVAFGGMYGLGQRGEPVEAADGVTEEAPVSAPEVQVSVQPAPVTPEPAPEIVIEVQPQAVPVVEQLRPQDPAPIQTPEARLDQPERETEPVANLHKQVHDGVKPAAEAADLAFKMISKFSSGG